MEPVLRGRLAGVEGTNHGNLRLPPLDTARIERTIKSGAQVGVEIMMMGSHGVPEVGHSADSSGDGAGPGAHKCFVLTALLVATALLGACGSGASGAKPSAPTSSSPASANGPDGVATAYMHAVMAGDFTKASTYVAPDQRDVIKALGMSTGPGTLVKMTGKVSPGKTLRNGDQAVVVFVGRMCRVAKDQSGGTSSPDCTQNKDANSENPAFRVQLTRAAGRWQVSLPTPSASPS